MEREVTTTYLEMTGREELRPAKSSEVALEIIQATIPCPELSRFLYAAVGWKWFWHSRLSWDYAQWFEHLSRPEVETWVGYVDGTPVGYFELEGQGAEVEVAYFGLLPAFVGKRLGGVMLTAALKRAWELNPSRVWVHTCDLDHRSASKNYEARGFQVYRTETKVETLPDEALEPWPGARWRPTRSQRSP